MRSDVIVQQNMPNEKGAQGSSQTIASDLLDLIFGSMSFFEFNTEMDCVIFIDSKLDTNYLWANRK